MENYFNLLYYFLYKVHFKSHILINYINPIRLLVKLSFIKKRLEKKGISDFNSDFDELYRNKEFGMSISFATGILTGGFYLFIFAVLNTIKYEISIYSIIGIAILSISISYYYVFKKDKYLKYFDKYAKWTPIEKWKNSLLAFASVIFVFLFFCWSLRFTV